MQKTKIKKRNYISINISKLHRSFNNSKMYYSGWIDVLSSRKFFEMKINSFAWSLILLFI